MILEKAIKHHGGEAQVVERRFDDLTPKEKKALIAFLEGSFAFDLNPRVVPESRKPVQSAVSATEIHKTSARKRVGMGRFAGGPAQLSSTSLLLFASLAWTHHVATTIDVNGASVLNKCILAAG